MANFLLKTKYYLHVN